MTPIFDDIYFQPLLQHTSRSTAVTVWKLSTWLKSLMMSNFQSLPQHTRLTQQWQFENTQRDSNLRWYLTFSHLHKTYISFNSSDSLKTPERNSNLWWRYFESSTPQHTSHSSALTVWKHSTWLKSLMTPNFQPLLQHTSHSSALTVWKHST